MAEIIIYGASDDLIEIGGAISEEFDIYERTTLILAAPNGDELAVILEYGPHEWEINVRATSGDGKSPSWPIRFGDRPDREGDPAVFIDAPAGTSLTKENN